MHIAILPGLWLQKLTTNQPDDEMVEVAIASLKAVLPEDERIRMKIADETPPELVAAVAAVAELEQENQ